MSEKVNARALLPENALMRLSKFQPCLPDGVQEELAVREQLDVKGARKVVGAPHD